jgi:hypothetical protein
MGLSARDKDRRIGSERREGSASEHKEVEFARILTVRAKDLVHCHTMQTPQVLAKNARYDPSPGARTTPRLIKLTLRPSGASLRKLRRVRQQDLFPNSLFRRWWPGQVSNFAIEVARGSPA